MKHIILPTFDVGTNLSQQSRLTVQNANQLFSLFPAGVTAREVISDFATFGLLSSLDPAYFDTWLADFNRVNPTGLGPTLDVTIASLISYSQTLSGPTVELKLQISALLKANAREKDLLSFLNRTLSDPTGPQSLAVAITNHSKKAKVLACIAPHLKDKSPVSTSQDSTSLPTVSDSSSLTTVVGIQSSLEVMFM